ncbi:MAG TPA: undecaprenyl-diphosphate phosphatase [Chloroflexota bacterium]
MTLFHAIIIALLQGVSELFPVSSLGHAVLLPRLLHWGINEKSDTWLSFLVALHIGTAVALLVYFRDDWVSVVMAFVRSVQTGQMSTDNDQRLAWMVVLGTIPAGLVGLALQNPLRTLFGSPYVAAAFLIVNGLIMFTGERLLQRQMAHRAETRGSKVQLQRVVGGDAVPAEPSGAHPVRPDTGRYRDITELSWRDAAIVGLAQIGALIPGISRSGVTMVAGLAAGLTHEAAARYTFLLATPIIAAAGVLELPLLFDKSGRSVLGDAIVGMILAGIAAYLAVRYLMRYFEFGGLYPFAYYCCAAGAVSLILLTIT